MAQVVKLTFVDGEDKEVTVGPAVLVLVERHFNGNIPQLEGTFYACWLKLGRPGESFDKWLATIDDFERVTPEDEAAAPFDEEPSPGP